MPELQRWRSYLRFFGPDIRADVDDEMQFHLEMRVRDLVSRGLSSVTAREEAERQFGDLRTIRRACVTIDERRLRRSHRREVFADMNQDIRFAARSLRKSPGFTAMAVLCVALGVAVTTTIFTAVHGILIRPLPYPGAEALISVYARMIERDARGVNIGYPDYISWRDENRTLAALGIWTWSTATLSGDVEAERVDGAYVSANLFPLLGVRPALGRGFAPNEEKPGAEPVILLSHGLWQRRFAGDRSLVGKTITVDGQPNTVVGVMPPGFNFPDRGQVWTPLIPDQRMEPRGNRFLAGAIGRLRPGVTVEQARADLSTISARLAREYPDANTGFDADVVTLRDDLVGDLRRPLLVFLGAVAMVLLVACANVANLMLARGASRQREAAVRVSLGASRGRIVRHVLAESLVLAAVGGVIGAILTRFGVRLLRLAFPGDVPFYISLDIDRTVLLFVVLLSGVTAILFGLAPALRASRVDLTTTLHQGGRGGSGGSVGGSRLRSGLVVAEVALSLVLLIGATLLIKSYSAYIGTNLGFDERGIMAARISLPAARYADIDRRRTFWQSLFDRLDALPGVDAVGSASGIPFSGWNVQSYFSIEGRPPRGPGNRLDVHNQRISPDYFRAIGVPILRGRGFTAADRDTSANIGIINEVFAKQEFAGVDPIGKRLKAGGAEAPDRWITIIGVARDFRHYDLPQPMRPAIYFPQMARPSLTQTIVLRTSLAEPLALDGALRSVLRELDAEVPPYGVQTFEQVVARSLWRQRVQGQVLGAFAALALLLAVVGMYGVISYAVAQRTREMGVRMALGATPRHVVRLVVGQGVKLTVVGVVIGVAGALATTRVLATLLYGVEATDLTTFVVVPLILAVVALVASWVPAHRATRVDPVIAIRTE